MADFTRWGCAIAMALGYEQKEFIEAYEHKVRDQIREASHASAVATVLLNFMETRPSKEWKGSPSELFGALNSHAKDIMGVSIRQREWPKAPHSLARKLNELTPSLNALGWEVVTRRTGASRRMEIKCVTSVTSDTQPSDVSDTSDAISPISSRDEKEDEPTTCCLCHKLLPKNLVNCTVEDGKYCHLDCALNLKKGRKDP